MNQLTKLNISLSLFFLYGCDKLPLQIATNNSNSDIRILIAGQSNGNSPDNSFGSLFSSTNHVHIKHTSYGDTDFIIPTIDNPRTYDISWLILGDDLYLQTKEDIYIDNVSYGNTDSNAWSIYYLNTLIQEIKQFDPNYIIWIQGESDRLNNLTEEQSKRSYIQIFTAIKNNKPRTCKVYIALDGFYLTSDGGIIYDTSARKAQKYIIQQNLALQGIDLDLMRLQHRSWFETGLGAELAGEGLKEHAYAWEHLLF